MAKKVKLGRIFDNPFYIKCPVAANQTWKRRSGHFVYLSSNYVTIADSGTTQLFGVALIGKDWTGSSTAGADVVTVDTHPFHVWEVPARDTFTAANLASYIGDTCDLEVSSNIQYVDNGESSEDTVVIVGGDVDEQTLYVHMNPNACYQTGIA